MRLAPLALIPVVFMLDSAVPSHAAQAEEAADTWNLADLYPTLEAWDSASKTLETRIARLDQWKGRLGEGPEVLLECLNEQWSTLRELRRHGSYASNSYNQDTRDSAARGRRQSTGMLGTKFQQKGSWLEPELLALGEAKVLEYLEQEEGLAPYRFYLTDTLRNAPHTLGAEAEGVLAAAGNITYAPASIYQVLTSAELPWPTITLSDGTEIRLDQSTYGRYRSSKSREDRKLVFDTFYGMWEQFEGTVGASLNAQINSDWFRASTRKYESSLAAALNSDNIPVSVYRTLVEETNANLPTLHRYLKLRGRMLGVEDLAYYDIYPPLVERDITFPLEEGRRLSLESSKPLGADYVEAIRKGFDERWMDAYPRQGKSPGAYMSASAYDVHPYVLMNYNDDWPSVSTLAHEWGHAMHSWLSVEEQPFPTSRYATFIAEIASTFNEALLLDHVLKNSKDDDERLYYLGYALEDLRGTYFRQAMFAEFELAIHEAVEAGEGLTGARLSEIYLELVRRYHGHDAGVMRVDEAYGREWAYVPHFYYDFYVFQYATSVAASSLLAETVLEGKKGAVERYLTLLRAGGSDYPTNLLEEAGVDMESPEPYRALVARMNTIMDEIEVILERREKKVKKKGKGTK